MSAPVLIAFLALVGAGCASERRGDAGVGAGGRVQGPLHRPDLKADSLPSATSSLEVVAKGPVVICADQIHGASGLAYLRFAQTMVKGLAASRPGDDFALVFWPNDAQSRLRVWRAADIRNDWQAVDDAFRERAGGPDPLGFDAGLRRCIDLAKSRGARLIILADRFAYFGLSAAGKQLLQEASRSLDVDLLTVETESIDPRGMQDLLREHHFLSGHLLVVMPGNGPSDATSN